MKEQMEEFLANLMSVGFSRSDVAERGYTYALALQTDQLPKDSDYVPASCMARAAELLKDALPGARRLYDRRNQVR
jgi:hypothetical protein